MGISSKIVKVEYTNESYDVEIKVGDEISGSILKDAPRAEKNYRKATGLPVTKQLVYYANARNVNSIKKVDKVRVVEIYDKTDFWMTFEIVLEDGTTVRIHSDFLSEMQKPSFVRDYIQQEKQQGE